MDASSELVVADRPDAVPRAREFTSASVAGAPDALVEAAKLLVTELVTNALLHGAPPVRLRLTWREDWLRVEVDDAGHAVPVRARHSDESMTGRGLTLVAALADAWGVEPSPAGKTMWAEIRATPQAAGSPAVPPELDVEALLAAWNDEEPGVERFNVRLGSVPTDLLLAAKAHIDNVVRELTLAGADTTAAGTELPPAMQALVRAVTVDFAEARAEIKRQALAAADAGEPMTNLVLRLPADAAEAGERYLAALDEADRYARDARLLTIAPPAAHHVFRRWYLRSLIDQLRAHAHGRPPPALAPLHQSLVEEIERLAPLDEAWRRLQVLQKVTAELTGAATVAEIANTVVSNAAEFLGASSARVYLVGDDRVLRSVAVRSSDTAAAASYHEIPMDADLPGPVVARSGRPLSFRSVAQLVQRFPTLAGIYRTERSLHVAPMQIGDRVLGVLSLTFPAGSDVAEATQMAFLGSLADTLAQAAVRVQAMERAETANARLSFLADASVALSASLDYRATLEAVTELMTPRFADWCVVQLVGDDTLETVALRHVDPAKVAWAKALQGRYPTRLDAPTGAPAVVRTGRSEVYPELSPDLVEQSAVDDEHRTILRNLGMTSAAVVPLPGRAGMFGAITLIYAGSGRHYSPADLPYLEDVARRAALALETADAFRRQSGRLADVRRVADAAQQAILAPPPARLGPLLLAARYVSAASDALVGGDLYEVVPHGDAVRLLVGDVRGKGLPAVRAATIVLGEFRAAAADCESLVTVAEQIDRRLRSYLADEDFVTAVLAEVHDDGRYAVASCGHPPPLLARAGSITELDPPAGLPLGLGACPELLTGRLLTGDRLLLYTDGLIEARAPDGRFVDLAPVAARIANGDLDRALDQVLARLHREVGHALTDDLALLAAQYAPSPERDQDSPRAPD